MNQGLIGVGEEGAAPCALRGVYSHPPPLPRMIRGGHFGVCHPHRIQLLRSGPASFRCTHPCTACGLQGRGFGFCVPCATERVQPPLRALHILYGHSTVACGERSHAHVKRGGGSRYHRGPNVSRFRSAWHLAPPRGCNALFARHATCRALPGPSLS